MRLSDEYRAVIKETLLKHFGQTSKFYLFGSRTDDSKRGGDIDLYIETDLDKDLVSKSQFEAHCDLMNKLGEQKIDIIVHINGTEFKPIEKIAQITGVML